MKRKFWGYLSLAILLSQPVLAPLAQVMAEEQETIPSNKEITTLGTLEKVEETTETVDSSRIKEEINGDTTSNSESQEVVNDDEKSGSTESTEKNLPDSSKDTASSATESSAEMKLFMFTVLIKRMNREKIQEKIHQNQKTRRRTKRTGIAQEITASKQTHKPNQKISCLQQENNLQVNESWAFWESSLFCFLS